MEFAKAISQEKKRIRTELTALTREKTKVDRKIASLQKEMDAVVAYEKAKKGSSATGVVRKRRPRKSKQPVKQQILGILGDEPMKPKEIKTALPAIKPQTISNTLSAMKREGVVKHANGAYSTA